jgi:hypothetical protein
LGDNPCRTVSVCADLTEFVGVGTNMLTSIGRRAAASAIVILFAGTAFGQDAGAPAASQAAADDQEVKLSVTLVQVDAVVTDKQRRQVTDLKASDFEIFEDGVPQQVTTVATCALPRPRRLRAARPVRDRASGCGPIKFDGRSCSSSPG